MRRLGYWLLLLAVASLLNCSSSCEDNRGKIAVKNNSSIDHQVFLNGQLQTTLVAGGRDVFDVDVGVHQIEWRKTDDSLACQSLTVDVKECQEREWACAGN